jgi:hypothetical protein
MQNLGVTLKAMQELRKQIEVQIPKVQEFKQIIPS